MRFCVNLLLAALAASVLALAGCGSSMTTDARSSGSGGVEAVMRDAATAAATVTASPEGATVDAANRTDTEIVSLSSGQCATVDAYSTTAGTPIVQSPCEGVSEQRWSLTPSGNYYHIVSVGSGQCLNVSSGSTAKGDPIIQWPCQTNGATNDQWSIVAVGQYYELVSAFDGQCLNVDNNSLADGAALIQWPCASFEPSNYNDVWSLAAPSGAKITDSSGNVWTITSGVIYRNGAEAGKSANVAQLLYDNNDLYQENTAGLWYVWNGSTWIPAKDPRATSSPSGTIVPAATQITDSSGNIWAIDRGEVYENGALAGESSNVTELLYDGGSIYQENSAGKWYLWNGSTWTPTSAPAVGTSTLSWTAPTENTNGTRLTDLAGYRIYYGSAPGALTHSIQLADPKATSYVVGKLSPGTYYFSVAAYATDGTQSPLSSVGSKVIL
jgi:hypothetical protein